MGNLEFEQLRSEFECALNTFVQSSIPEGYGTMLALISYHLGWEGEGAGHEAQGKRIRPMLLLLSCASGGGDWKNALPAAIAVELVHNFSLVHDDIQDNSPLRRGRPTLWTKWGIPQAINMGDLLFNLAFTSIVRLNQYYAPELALRATEILTNTCTLLTGGQFLDLSYETTREQPLEAYWPMVAGKTAALLSCCTEVGALCAEMSYGDRAHFKTFGQKLGLAFQVWDDYLGIWGDSTITGKSVASDLVTGKKTLPVLYALTQNGTFAKRWRQGAIAQGEVPALSEALIIEGAQAFVESTASRLTKEALEALERTSFSGDGCLLLKELASSLLHRNY